VGLKSGARACPRIPLDPAALPAGTIDIPASESKMRLKAERRAVAEFDLAAHVERSRQGPCFVCAYLCGHPGYRHEHIFLDDHVVAFLSRYPTLLGYTIVAPRTHVVEVTGNRELFRRVGDVVHDVAEALKAVLPTQRIYLMALGSH
jgi:galactose-1-phosphate uridylyltransferase